jgi:broad specificity phosphatase PhoE
MKKPLLYLVRHGSTTDSNKNIFRGQRDAALDKKGFSDAHALKDFFKKKEWHRIFCSPMTRAIQTATIICDDQADYQPETTPGLEPWNIGVMTGAFKTPKNKEKMEHFITNPEDAPKNGESLREFEHRVWPLLASGVELGWKQGKPCIAVVHSSLIHSFNHLMQGVNHEDKAVKPGGVVEVFMEDGEIFHEPVFKAATDEDSSLDPKNAS